MLELEGEPHRKSGRRNDKPGRTIKDVLQPHKGGPQPMSALINLDMITRLSHRSHGPSAQAKHTYLSQVERRWGRIQGKVDGLQTLLLLCVSTADQQVRAMKWPFPSLCLPNLMKISCSPLNQLHENSEQCSPA